MHFWGFLLVVFQYSRFFSECPSVLLSVGTNSAPWEICWLAFLFSPLIQELKHRHCPVIVVSISTVTTFHWAATCWIWDSWNSIFAHICKQQVARTSRDEPNFGIEDLRKSKTFSWFWCSNPEISMLHSRLSVEWRRTVKVDLVSEYTLLHFRFRCHHTLQYLSPSVNGNLRRAGGRDRFHHLSVVLEVHAETSSPGFRWWVRYGRLSPSSGAVHLRPYTKREGSNEWEVDKTLPNMKRW